MTISMTIPVAIFALYGGVSFFLGFLYALWWIGRQQRAALSESLRKLQKVLD